MLGAIAHLLFKETFWNDLADYMEAITADLPLVFWALGRKKELILATRVFRQLERRRVKKREDDR